MNKQSVSPSTTGAPAPYCHRRFLADRMLNRLGRWLRAAGHDVVLARDVTEVNGSASSRILFGRAATDHRVFLTRNRLLEGKPRCLVLEPTELDEQLAAIFATLDGDPLAEIFSRCMQCNERLTRVLKETVAAEIPPAVRETREEFFRCPACRRLYWEGSHTRRIEERLRKAVRETRPRETTGDIRTREALNLLLEKLLPRLGLRTASFRKKRRTIRSRLHKRMDDLGLSSYAEYLAYLAQHPDEENRLHRILAITVSRFFRNREDWFVLARRVFPAVAALALKEHGERPRVEQVPKIRAASIGCASGEEPYSLVVAWKEWGLPDVALEVLAFDLEETCLERAWEGVYPRSSFRSMPEEFLERYFEPLPGAPDQHRVAAPVRELVEFAPFDYLRDPWPRHLHLLLVRHSAFFYLADRECRRALALAAESVVPGGWLFVGSNEHIPPWQRGWTKEGRNLYRKRVEATGDA